MKLDKEDVKPYRPISRDTQFLSIILLYVLFVFLSNNNHNKMDQDRKSLHADVDNLFIKVEQIQAELKAIPKLQAKQEVLLQSHTEGH